MLRKTLISTGQHSMTQGKRIMLRPKMTLYELLIYYEAAISAPL